MDHTEQIALIDQYGSMKTHMLPTTLALRVVRVWRSRSGRMTTYVARAYDLQHSPYRRARKDGYQPIDIVSWSVFRSDPFTAWVHRRNREMIDTWNDKHHRVNRSERNGK